MGDSEKYLWCSDYDGIKSILPIYIEKLLEEYGYFQDAPDIPITDVYVHLRERQIKEEANLPVDSARTMEMADKGLMQLSQIEPSYGGIVELQEAIKKTCFHPYRGAGSGQDYNPAIHGD